MIQFLCERSAMAFNTTKNTLKSFRNFNFILFIHFYSLLIKYPFSQLWSLAFEKPERTHTSNTERKKS
jgi:hypothetical protein